MSIHRHADSSADLDGSMTICDAIEHVRGYLSSQGPIDNFIHHNTFHHFEHVAFEEAVEHVAHLLRAEPYLAHEEFCEAWRRGRITDADVDAELTHRLGATPPTEHTDWRKQILMAALQIPERRECARTVRWWLEDGRGLKDFDPAVSTGTKTRLIAQSQGQNATSALTTLWNAVEKKLDENMKLESNSSSAGIGIPEDRSLGDISIRIVAAYLDRGTAQWHMPERDHGLWHCMVQLAKYRSPIVPNSVDRLRHDERLVHLMQSNGMSACAYLLNELDPTRKHWQEIIQRELLALPGWAGMLATLEERNSLPDKNRSYPALVDYIAVRLLLKRDPEKTVFETTSQSHSMNIASFAAQLFRVAQVMGLSARDIEKMPQKQWAVFCKTLNETSDFMRRRILQGAYERSYRQQFFTALQQNAKQKNSLQTARPKFQAMFCLDEREESFRRHLEDCEPNCITFGVAGFFGVDMLYHPHDAMNPEPFCPAPVKPKHLIKERLVQPRTKFQKITPQFKSTLKLARNRFWGAPLLPSAALIDSSRLFLNVHWSGELMRIGRKLRPIKQGPTELSISRSGEQDQQVELSHGYTILEMADRVEAILRMVGLTSNFADLVFLIGHGSTTTNNHFQSAYDCGACGGRRGQYNGRVFAGMANDRNVRGELQKRGIAIPDDTIFVGGIHDTCSESIVFFDSDVEIRTHLNKITNAEDAFNEARRRNAHERFRRFGDTSKLSKERALSKVETRAHHAAEVRPEYGHGSNAASFVGRRSTTRGLFLDRRCFLTSYDAAQDPTGKILKGLLSAIMPVCSGINLEYYFSRVDNHTFGCGSKLPHNLTSMVGVVDGPASDLRSGLPWQTVEIHEPMRLLTIIEAEVDFVLNVLNQLPQILEQFDKGWGQLAVLSPSTHEIFLRVNGAFEKQDLLDPPAKTQNSRMYYDGRNDHLPPAIITAGHLVGAPHAS